MSTDLFINLQYPELVALQRVFREAKFCPGPSDDEIAASPAVGRLYRSLLKTLIDTEVERKGDAQRAQWQRWLHLDESRDEWHAALARARRELRWGEWDQAERLDYAKDLLSPFEVTDADLLKFIAAVDRRPVAISALEVQQRITRLREKHADDGDSSSNTPRNNTDPLSG